MLFQAVAEAAAAAAARRSNIRRPLTQHSTWQVKVIPVFPEAQVREGLPRLSLRPEAARLPSLHSLGRSLEPEPRSILGAMHEASLEHHASNPSMGGHQNHDRLAAHAWGDTKIMTAWPPTHA